MGKPEEFDMKKGGKFEPTTKAVPPEPPHRKKKREPKVEVPKPHRQS
jgi:hypothetical protein